MQSVRGAGKFFHKHSGRRYRTIFDAFLQQIVPSGAVALRLIVRTVATLARPVRSVVDERQRIAGETMTVAL